MVYFQPSLILFLSKCRIYGAPVFLSDPDLLPKIDKWLANPVTDINILLSNKRVVSFGFLDDKWTVERKVCTLLALIVRQLKTINISFETDGKIMVLDVPILKVNLAVTCNLKVNISNLEI